MNLFARLIGLVPRNEELEIFSIVKTALLMKVRVGVEYGIRTERNIVSMAQPLKARTDLNCFTCGEIN
jgi:hypothetical protein